MSLSLCDRKSDALIYTQKRLLTRLPGGSVGSAVAVSSGRNEPWFGAEWQAGRTGRTGRTSKPCQKSRQREQTASETSGLRHTPAAGWHCVAAVVLLSRCCLCSRRGAWRGWGRMEGEGRAVITSNRLQEAWRRSCWASGPQCGRVLVRQRQRQRQGQWQGQGQWESRQAGRLVWRPAGEERRGLQHAKDEAD